MKISEKITQDLNELNEAQLKEVAEFIAFLKFRARFNNPINNINAEKIAKLYREFDEEDRNLAEAGISEYAELLKQEDLQ